MCPVDGSRIREPATASKIIPPNTRDTPIRSTGPNHLGPGNGLRGCGRNKNSRIGEVGFGSVVILRLYEPSRQTKTPAHCPGLWLIAQSSLHFAAHVDEHGVDPM